MVSLFKICSGCGKPWVGRSSYLGDPEIRLIGYQARLDDVEAGLFLFNHNQDGCHTTMCIRVTAFLDLYQGRPHPSSNYRGPTCEGHCDRIDDLHPCARDCSNAWVRQLMQVIRGMAKAEAETEAISS